MQPLQGIVVVAVEQAVAGPICTRHLGDLGARVVKVENRAGGDFARDYDDVVHGMSPYFAWADRNKESVAIDLKHPLGRAAQARLVARADVLVQNLAPGAAARLGLDPAELRASRPELITVDISGFGKGGPYARGRAYDLLAQAEAGSCAVTGTPGQPVKPGIPIADIGAGMYALSSVLTALLMRERTGAGTAISVGLSDVVAEWMGFALNQHLGGGASAGGVPEGGGGRRARARQAQPSDRGAYPSPAHRARAVAGDRIARGAGARAAPPAGIGRLGLAARPDHGPRRAHLACAAGAGVQRRGSGRHAGRGRRRGGMR